jgi:hypothetical protein
MAPRRIRIDHREFLFIAGDVAEDQWQTAASDRSKANHHNRTAPLGVDGPRFHFIGTPVVCCEKERPLIE